MTDNTLSPQNMTKKKPGRPPQKKDASSGSRISYKDRNKITANNRDPNFHYRIVNTDNEKYSGRVEKMLAMGYTVVNDGESLGDSHGVDASGVGSATRKHVGHGTHGVLMRIPMEYYLEDQAAKQAEVDQTELGMVADELKDANGMYGEGLKVADEKGSRLEVKVRK